jgi:cell division protein FtsN
VEALEERAPFVITPEKRGILGLRSYAKYAAIVFLAIASGISVYTWNNNHSKAVSLAQSQAQKQITERIQSATFFASEPLELPTLILEVTSPEPEVLSHHIIAGAFRIKENADLKIQQLQGLGYDAVYVGENRFGLHQVAYASFANPQEAKEALKEIKRSGNTDAWLYSER